MRELAPDDRWDFTVRLLGALHYLRLAGRMASWEWPDVRETLVRERAMLARFVREQNVQTNEVQRSWALLPAFLTLGERALDVLELGSSAGLNLVWDRYAYRYAAGRWGLDDAPLALEGEERGAVPRDLLARRPHVLRRRGVDLNPVDVSNEEAVRLLTCFVWPDQTERLERLCRAIAVLRRDPPQIVRGDYVELLPELLADRKRDALTVVFQTVSTAYLPRGRYERLRQMIAGAHPPVAWISTRRPFEEETELEAGFELELQAPGEARARLVARMGYHGQWLEWLDGE